MAFVHPSRAALVPQDPTYSKRDSRRSPSPHRRRSPSPRRSRSREYNRTRRASPEYEDYKRPLPPADSQAPWRQPGSDVRDRPPNHGGNSYSGDMMESRRAKRDAAVVNVWPPSPKAPHRDFKKSKRHRSASSGSSEGHYHRRKERNEKRKAKEDKERRSRKYDDSESDSYDRHRRGRRSRRSQSRDRRSPSLLAAEDDDWVVKSVTPVATAPPPVDGGVPSNPSSAPVAAGNGESDDDEVGPQPFSKQTTSKRLDERAYGGSLLRGEGSAMAAFLQDGTEARIPRRGEIGLKSDEIAKFEDVGYVMSGSRHRRMNAVRMRKENQVISAEEKRGILKLQKEERERRETILREEFSELVAERLKGTERNKT
ncbi:ras-induced vulval development antagonist-domain-containing protein [Mycena pura]|uniref:Ras-induced vulval development antagonist-domain-containing protein n=1 Tax=Mycena pura TaxID=153505 RepID=A0AAD6YFN4_9AGAR|nr:ras-induced vulval development antagonist-domain-containing protein [Mycena pura]